MTHWSLLLTLACTLCFAGEPSERPEDALLSELKKLNDPPGPAEWKGLTADQARGLARQRADRALDLARDFATRFPRSPALNEARCEALKVLSNVPDEAVAARATRLAEEVKQSAPRGSEWSAQAELFLLGQRIHPAVKDARSADEFKAHWRRHTGEVRRQAEAFLEEHPTYRAGADAINGLAYLADMAGDAEMARALRAAVARHFPDHPAARVVAREQALGKEFTLRFTPAGSNRPINLRDLRGKVVVINFWASWCQPARAELARLRERYDKHHNDGLEIIGVSLDEKDEPALQFIRDHRITWPQIVGEPARKLGEEWGIEHLPVLLVVDRKGRLRSIEGAGKLDQVLGELLKERE